jgi:hypothetical protein
MQSKNDMKKKTLPLSIRRITHYGIRWKKFLWRSLAWSDLSFFKELKSQLAARSSGLTVEVEIREHDASLRFSEKHSRNK